MNTSDRPVPPRVVVVGAGIGRAGDGPRPVPGAGGGAADRRAQLHLVPAAAVPGRHLLHLPRGGRPGRSGAARRNPAAAFRTARVVGVDWQTREVLLDDGAATFDYLVLAAGVVSAFASVPDAAAHAISLKLVTTRPGCGTGCCARSKPPPPSRARRSPARPASPSSAAARPASSCPATSPASCSATSSKPTTRSSTPRRCGSPCSNAVTGCCPDPTPPSAATRSRRCTPRGWMSGSAPRWPESTATASPSAGETLFADNAMRLIGELGDAGTTGSIRPPCPRCSRVIFRSGYGGVTVVQW